MSTRNDGGQAFPGLKAVDVQRAGNSVHVAKYAAEGGVSLRDYFAAKAMQGLIADGHTMWDSSTFQGNREQIAGFAYAMADAMLLERSK